MSVHLTLGKKDLKVGNNVALKACQQGDAPCGAFQLRGASYVQPCAVGLGLEKGIGSGGTAIDGQFSQPMADGVLGQSNQPRHGEGDSLERRTGDVPPTAVAGEANQ